MLVSPPLERALRCRLAEPALGNERPISAASEVSIPITSDLLKPGDRVVQAQKLLTTEAGDTILMMSVDGGLFCGLDDIGSDVWRRLARPMTIAALCDALAADYRGDREQMLADVLELLSSLRAENLIDVV